MPKTTQKRLFLGHTPSAKPSTTQRQFAVQENAVKHVEIGLNQDLSANDILEALSSDPSQAKNMLKKKEKQQLKREAFAERLASTLSPYHSKSHARREKRRLRDQLAGGGMEKLEQVLDVLVDEPASSASQPAGEHPANPTPTPVQGMISESKRSTLTAKQRKKALQTERTRQSMILTNPSFAANPFEAIRIHASNTLVKHQAPSA